MSKAKSNYTLITLNDGGMVIEHKGKFAYFPAMANSSNQLRFDKIKDRLDGFCFGEKKHADSDVSISVLCKLNYNAF